MSYIGNTATQQAFTPAVDFFNGNGSTTAFTLSRPVASVAQVQAVIENVPQKPSDAFTVSGNTITFTSAPPSGTQNIYVYYTSPITQVIAPGQGTVGPTALTAGAPTWSPLGGVTLPRIDSTNEGGQLNFNRASDDTAVWSIDSFGGTSTPTLRFINGATVAMAIDGSNNVGIGTSSPSTKLHVSGGTSSVSGSNGITGIANGNTSGGMKLYAFTAAGTANGYLAFEGYDKEYGRFDTSGNFLVGTTSAANSAMLCVAGTVSASFTGRMYSLGTYNNTTGNAANMHIASDGHMFRSTSSLKYKTDVQDATHGLSEVMALRPVTYKGKNDGDVVFGGLIAEEVHEAGLIEFVQYAEDGTPDALAYGNMVSLCIKAIQEQQAIIEQLTQRITALEAK